MSLACRWFFASRSSPAKHISIYSILQLREPKAHTMQLTHESMRLYSTRHWNASYHFRFSCSAFLCCLFAYSCASAQESIHPTANNKTDERQSVEQPITCQLPVDLEFEDRIWNRVLASKCLPCHRPGGDATESDFILTDLKKFIGQARDQALESNRQTLLKMAKQEKDGVSMVPLKALGELSHGGGTILTAQDPEFLALDTYVTNYLQHADGSVHQQEAAADNVTDDPNFWEGIRFKDNAGLLRRAALSLVGRLPSAQELAELETGVALHGESALREKLMGLMSEEPFYERLREGFNDIFLITAVDDNPEVAALSYEHFEKSRLWYQQKDWSHIKDEKEREKAGYKLVGEYRQALLREPMMLIDHIVRSNRPFTEIVTADYIMVSPYTARGYGVFEEVQNQFKNVDDPFEYVPIRLKALHGRNRSEDQESPTGYFPHAGLMTTFLYLTRYPTTETNRNRLRSRMVYQHFLGVDILELAARVSDAAAVNAKYEVPTMQAAECVVCHRTLDPVAGLYQDYWRFEANFAVYGKRKGGWFTDMFPAGFEGETLPESERWRALQWFGERIAADPRFAVTMTEHVYYLLTGRKVLKAPTDYADPLYAARLQAYREQRRTTERIAQRFSENGFQLKDVFCDWILSEFYRVDGVESLASQPCRLMELDDIGLVHLLSPEQLERKINAVFGEKWNRLDEEMGMLYGGIDLKEVTERAADPSGAMGAIQRIMSNDVACKHVPRDFALPKNNRLLFPYTELTTVPGAAEAREEIEKTVVHLHQRILGKTDTPKSDDVQRTVQLFEKIVKDSKEQQGLDQREIWSCRQGEAVTEDPAYTLRAWRAVVTYLLRRPEFLYE